MGQKTTRVGIILQRSVLICSLALFPVVVLFLNAESILLILYQSPCVARYAYTTCPVVAMHTHSIFVYYYRLTGIFCKIMALALPVSIHAYYNGNHVLCICVCTIFTYVCTCIYVSGLKPDHYH